MNDDTRTQNLIAEMQSLQAENATLQDENAALYDKIKRMENSWDSLIKQTTIVETDRSRLERELKSRYQRDVTAPWYVDPKKLPIGQKYCLLPGQPKDFELVADLYKKCPVPGYDLKSVRVVFNSDLAVLFTSKIDLLEERHGKTAFSPKWNTDSDPQAQQHRQRVMKLFYDISIPFAYKRVPHVSFIPAWHGTNVAILESLFTTGYANLAVTDTGFFGKGLYSTTEAEYAHRVYSAGALLVNWVAVHSAYPVIATDEQDLAEKANFGNYDAHFVPVYSSRHPKSVSYHACEHDEPHQYTELVVFDSAQVLPHYIVELQGSLLEGPVVLADTTTNAQQKISKMKDWNTSDVCKWMAGLNLSDSYETIINFHGIDGKVLVTMNEADWEKLGVVKFGDLRKLGFAVAKLLK